MRKSFFAGLTSIKSLGVLNEANDDVNKYSLDDEDPVNDKDETTNDADNTEDNSDEINSYGLDDNGDDTNDEADNVDDSDAGADSNAPDDNQTDNTDDMGGNADDPNNTEEVPDDTASTDNDTSDIKILNLSEESKQLNNLRLIKQYRELKNNIEALVSRLGVGSFTATQQVLVDKLLTNLNELLEQVRIAITVNYSDTYETNVKNYLTYLQNYNIIVKLARKIYDMTNDKVSR